MSGLQCHKRLYLECFHRELADPVLEQQQEIFDSGTEVGVLARRLFPGGVLVTEDYTDQAGAMASTRGLLARTQVPPLYEAAFLYDGVRMRADVLVPQQSGTFDLVEVKSTSRLKSEHLYDVAIQWYVLNKQGLRLRKACLCHLNSSYIYPGGSYELDALFQMEDVTSESASRQTEIPSQLEEMRRPLACPNPPEVTISGRCDKPYTCPFYGHCHTNQTEHDVSQLPRAGAALLDGLRATGITNIRDIPASFPGLNPLQRRVRDCVVNHRLHVDPELPRSLQRLASPVHFLDFETFNPALPLYVGTRPYQQVPFQWSLHTLTGDESLTHREYLHDGASDPRQPFAASLVDALGDTGPVVVYSGFESARIRELAAALPGLSVRLLALLDGRLVDLLQLVRNHCYHPAFHGSFSIKSVLPALVPQLDYHDLTISDGATASIAYAEMIRPSTPRERRQKIRANLLAYCERDTLAEVELFRFFVQGRP
jgi:hypothetical protein